MLVAAGKPLGQTQSKIRLTADLPDWTRARRKAVSAPLTTVLVRAFYSLFAYKIPPPPPRGPGDNKNAYSVKARKVVFGKKCITGDRKKYGTELAVVSPHLVLRSRTNFVAYCTSRRRVERHADRQNADRLVQGWLTETGINVVFAKPKT